MNSKISFLRQRLEDRNIDGMIVSNETNIKYLINVDVEGLLLISPMENIFFTSARFHDHVSSILKIEDGIIIKEIEKSTRRDFENIFMGARNIGIEEETITYKEYQSYLQIFETELVETEGIVEEMRATKDDDELKYISYVSKILSDVYEKSVSKITKGMTEKQIALDITRMLAQSGLDGIPQEVRVQSSDNSTNMFFLPTSRRIKSGDVIIIYMSGTFRGYHAEMARTVFVDNVDEQKKEEYTKLLKLHDSLLRSIRNRASISEITKEYSKELEEINWDIKYYLAHGIGLTLKEAPEFITSTNKEIKERMTVVLEPGIYKQGYGLKIIDTMAITESNFKLLTTADRSIRIIN